jgi:hypothetical protein
VAKNSSKKQLGNEDLLTMWASTFRMRRDSANNSEASKTIHSFGKPATTLEIDPEYKKSMIIKA